MEFEVNKGVGKPIEFKGLKAQYIIFFAVGVAAAIFISIILAAIGLPTIIPILFGLLTGGAVVFISFRFNKVYGVHGLMKVRAKSYHPRFVINRKSVHSMFATLKANRRK